LRKERIMRVETGLVGHPFQPGFVAPGIHQIAATARRLEDLGFDGVGTAEAGGHDPFLPLAVAAEYTERVTLGTGVAVAFPRSPMVMAQIAWDLQRFSGGRFRLGLGTQDQAHNEGRFCIPWMGPPGPRIREYVLCLKSIFQTFRNVAQPTYFTGQYYQFTLMTPFFNPGPIEHPHVPVIIGAVGKYMARVAGEVCDGIFPNQPCTSKYIREVLLPAIEAGARKAGRQLSDIHIHGAPMIITGKNEGEVDAAKGAMKQLIGYYCSLGVCRPVLEVHGWLEVGQKLSQLSLEGKWQEMVDLVSDDMVEAFATVGTYEELGPRLKERWGGILSTIGLDLPSNTLEDERQVRKIIEDLRQP
jgi:probable F420-dependent oxidoreductase